MASNNKYTIDEVLDLESGEIVHSKDFFHKSLDEIHIIRSELQRAIQGARDSLYVCLYCKQKIRIRGSLHKDLNRKQKSFHFAHLKDSDECPIKTQNTFSKEEIDRMRYNGAKESPLHFNLKSKIAELLKSNESLIGEVSDIKIESVYRDKISKEWKKPDIQFNFQNKSMAIEIQLSTTWLDVITKRQEFYRNNQTYILWIFHKFNICDEERRLTDNDVIYTNNQNAFVFNEETIVESEKSNDLVLKCYYKRYNFFIDEIEETWEYKFIKLSELTFNEPHFKIYYYNCEIEKQKVERLRTQSGNVNTTNPNPFQNNPTKPSQRSLPNSKLDYNKISSLYNKLSDINRKISWADERLKNYQYIRENINDYLSKVFMWLTLNEYPRPDYFNNFLFELEKNYESILVTILTEKQEFAKRNDDLNRREDNINSLNNLDEMSQNLKIINPNTHMDFINQNISEIKFLENKLISPLFVENELKSIKNKEEYTSLRYKSNVVFVYDFSKFLLEIENEKREIKEKTKELEMKLNVHRLEINKFILEANEKENEGLPGKLLSLQQERTQILNELELEQYKEFVE